MKNKRTNNNYKSSKYSNYLKVSYSDKLFRYRPDLYFAHTAIIGAMASIWAIKKSLQILKD